MKILLAALFVSLAFVAPVQAHHRTLSDLDPSPVIEQSPFPPPVMTPAERDKWDRIVQAAEQRQRDRQSTAKRARIAHFSYTYDVMWQNLMNTNLDHACGWGANQYCDSASDGANGRPKAPFIGWVGYHSLDTEFIWAQYTYCVFPFACDVWDYCDVRVHVTDHNEGGRVNVNYAGTKYVWESSCNIEGPIAQVP